MANHGSGPLVEAKVPTSIKLSLLWASLMFLYIYNDYFSMYVHGTIENMQAGRLGPLGDITEVKLVMVATLLAVPALMIFLSVVLWRPVSRSLNVLLGLAYTCVEVLTFNGPLFYRIAVSLEIVLTLLIVWYAWRWTKRNPAE